MPRPKKCRRVGFIPNNQYFIPKDVEEDISEYINLHIEEVEAIRLSDLEGLEQDACAEKMEVSRGTYQRILNSGRKKLADALVNGKAIRIHGGHYTRNMCAVLCKQCGHQWESRYENINNKNDLQCPLCRNKETECVTNNDFCRGRCCRFGHRWHGTK